MDRRYLVKVLVAAPLAAETGICQHSAHGDGKPDDPQSYEPRFFTKDEYLLIDALADTILPADTETGGAHDAGVALFIDTSTLHAEVSVQDSWRAVLGAVDQASHDRFSRKFTDLDAPGRSQFMSALLANERSPQTTLEQFAVRLKAITIEAYSMSEVGMKYFGYRGNSGVAEFSGCTHADHKSIGKKI